ncbi:MAG: ATP-binding protein [Candidatus Paceibacterota bacterium]
MQNLFCPWESAQYFFFSSSVPSTLLYYSHGVSVIFALVFGFLLLFKARKDLSAKIFFAMTLLFSIWVFLDLLLWAGNNPLNALFFWSIQIMVEIFIYISVVYLCYVFIAKQDLSFIKKIILFSPIFPILILLPTKYLLPGVDINTCVVSEGNFIIYYSYIVEAILVVFLIFLTSSLLKEHTKQQRKEAWLFTSGIILFLLAFSSGNIIGSITENWEMAQIGLFVMPIFIGILAYLVVKYNAFNFKLIATQALVWGLAILIGSQFFFVKVFINVVLTGVTFTASIIFGYLLIRSVKKEIQQKEELAKLNIDLQDLIKQRESLVHLVTHKVKGSFTHSKYIFAGILDGTFGDVNDEVKKRAEQGLESDNMGIETVDLVLNVANMQKGLIKYDMKTIDFKEIVLKSISDKLISAEARGLKLETELKDGKDDNYNLLGDSVWLKEAVNNLIENSIKYTKEGKIIVGLEDGNGKIKLSVRDTGIGIDPDDKKNLFTEGGRGKDSVKVNVDSTGYGLYSVKLIAEAHKGKVWAESEGSGKGSTFFLELPAV